MHTFYYLSEYIFLSVKVDDYLKLYFYFDREILNLESYSFTNYIFQVEDEDCMAPPLVSFKKHLTEYLKDCLDFVEKINN